MLGVILSCHCPVTTGFVILVICTAKERLFFSFADYEMSILTLVTFDDGQITATEIISHEVADFGLVGADPELEADVGFVAELHGVSADRAAFDVLQVVGGLVVELAVHCDQRVEMWL